MEFFFIITHISKNRKIDTKRTHYSFNVNQTRDLSHQDKQIAKKKQKDKLTSANDRHHTDR